MSTSNTIGYLLQHLSTALARQSEEILQEKLGLGFSQFKILMALQWNPTTQQRQIADSLGQTEASVSRQIKIMHDKDLLKTEVSQGNRREHITTPTRKGAELTEKALVTLNNYHAPMFELLTGEQKQQLLETLQIMHEFACQPSKSGACHKRLN